MYWWDSFDAWEVRDEFDLIADLGMDVVRIFLLWDDWQPTASAVDRNRLRDLGVVCDAAASRGLGLDVTFFTGHMSGPNWAPRWMLDPVGSHPSPHVRQVVSGGDVVQGSYRNMYTDPEVIAASRLLVRTVVGSYRDHDAVWMWNLGNEPDLFAHPPSPQAGRAWVRSMREMIGEIDDHTPVTCGLHTASLFEDNGFRVDDVFAETDVGVMHGYPMYVPWAKDPLDADFVPFLCELTSALSGKPTLAEEWGGCTVPGASETWEWSPTAAMPDPSSWQASTPSPTTWDRSCPDWSLPDRPAPCCGASPTTPKSSGTAPPATPTAPNTNATSDSSDPTAPPNPTPT